MERPQPESLSAPRHATPSFRTEQADLFSRFRFFRPPPPRHFERSKPTLFPPLSVFPPSATPSFRTEQADFLFRFRSSRSPPPRHFERSKPTLFLPLSLLRKGRLADVRNLSSLRLHRAASPSNRG